VLTASLKAAATAGLTVKVLRTLADVDRPEDLPDWEKALRDDLASPLISVVIPTLDEAGRIGALVEEVRASAGAEVLVVDGGSSYHHPRRIGEPSLGESHGFAAGLGVLVQKQYFQPSLGQEGGAGAPAKASTYHNDIIGIRHSCFPFLWIFAQSGGRSPSVKQNAP
jgi:hypothetical protein